MEEMIEKYVEEIRALNKTKAGPDREARLDKIASLWAKMELPTKEVIRVMARRGLI